MKKLSLMLLVLLALFAFSACGSCNGSGDIGRPAPLEFGRDEKGDPSYTDWGAAFHSVDQLIDEILSGFLEEVSELIEGGDALKEFLHYIVEKNELVVPLYKGEILSMQQKNGYDVDMLYESGFSRTNIQYSGYMTDNHFVSNLISVETMYIDDDIVEEANEKGANWLIKTLAPGTKTPEFPNLDTYKKEKFIKDMYEDEIQLDGFRCKALIREDNDEARLFIYFVYENVFVTVRISPWAFDENMLADLSFTAVPLICDISSATDSATDDAAVHRRRERAGRAGSY